MTVASLGLSEVQWECVHFVSETDGSGVRDQAGKSRLIEIDAARISTKEQLMSALAAGFSFPEEFGHNWDALDECLRDLEWLAAPGYVLLLRNSAALWQRSPALSGALVQSWLSAAEHWGGQRVPFHLVFAL